jgi:hypothetical protein
METLLAVGTLAIGMVFVAGTFLAGVYFATLSTERTIATVVVDEAFAKIQLYGFDPSDPNLKTDGYVRYDHLMTLPADEYLYPSTSTSLDKQYCWSALCRRGASDSRLVEFTVFVSRKAGANSKYWDSFYTFHHGEEFQTDLPHPVRTEIAQDPGSPTDEIRITPTSWGSGLALVMDGASIVDDATGQVYRVRERLADPERTIRLDRPWTGGASGAIWVVSPPVGGGRDPLVAVYQKTLRF